MPNIFRMAESNSVALVPRFEAVKAGLHGARQRHLETLVDRILTDGRMSINLRQTDLLAFLLSGRYQNIYDWSRTRATKSSKTSEQILAERLGDLYETRVAFDRHFDDGESFKYSALNTGGLGATAYGDHCVILRADFSDNLSRLAYLRADSLLMYTRGTPVAVVDAALSTDLATHDARHLLAALKCGPLALDQDPKAWPRIVCSDADYIEGIFVSELTPANVETVRMALQDYEIYADYAFEDFRGSLSRAQRALVEVFVIIQDRLEQAGIPLTVIDDA